MYLFLINLHPLSQVLKYMHLALVHLINSCMTQRGLHGNE